MSRLQPGRGLWGTFFSEVKDLYHINLGILGIIFFEIRGDEPI